MTDYPGPERRKDNISLEARVRDLEEEARSNTKSRQSMHKQLGDINFKLDAVLVKMDAKNEECAEHQVELALLKQRQTIVERAQSIFTEDIKWSSRTAVTAVVGLLLGLIGYIWKVMVAK